MYSNSVSELNILVDPSLLIDEKTSEMIIEYVHQHKLVNERFFVPASFVRLLSDAERNMKDILFFADSARLVDLKELRMALEREEIVPFAVNESFPEEYELFFKSLIEETGSEIISKVLFEEWFFLQRRSWIISRIKKSFTKMNKAGAVSVEIGKRTLDLAVRKTLKKDENYILTNADKLRSIAKWIAVGGSAVVSLIPFGFLVGAATGYFLLIDP
jgi:hypothetical protein